MMFSPLISSSYVHFDLQHLLEDVTRFTTSLTLHLYNRIKKNLLIFEHVMYHVVQVAVNLLTQNGIML